jgi:hypothetical protein
VPMSIVMPGNKPAALFSVFSCAAHSGITHQLLHKTTWRVMCAPCGIIAHRHLTSYGCGCGGKKPTWGCFHFAEELTM